MQHQSSARDLSRTFWQPSWQTDRGRSLRHDPSEDGWWDHTGTVPVIATHLDQLRNQGPHGPVWWRFGRSEWQAITDALTNTGTEDEYHAREGQRRQEREVARVLEQQQRREELAGWEAVWQRPSCRTDVEPGTVGEDGYRPAAGGLCPACEHSRRAQAGKEVAAQDAAATNGILVRLRAAPKSGSRPLGHGPQHQTQIPSAGTATVLELARRRRLFLSWLKESSRPVRSVRSDGISAFPADAISQRRTACATSDRIRRSRSARGAVRRRS
ncbi:hypothetical protein [Streptomyces sp. NPDC002346]